jgi:hypothetical protein
LTIIAAALSFLFFLISWVYWTFLIRNMDGEGFMFLARTCGFLSNLFGCTALICAGIGLMLGANRLPKPPRPPFAD